MLNFVLCVLRDVRVGRARAMRRSDRVETESSSRDEGIQGCQEKSEKKQSGTYIFVGVGLGHVDWCAVVLYRWRWRSGERVGMQVAEKG